MRGVMARSTATGIEVERERIDLGEDRRRAHLQYGIGDGHKREGGHDHLIALADSQRQAAPDAARQCRS